MSERIKKINKKIIDFSKKHKYLVVSLLICLLIIGISRLVSYAFFTANDTKTLISGRVGDVTSPDLDIKVLVENRDSNGAGNGTYTTSYMAPTNGYTYNTSSSSCDNGTLTYNSSTNSFTITATGRTKCYVYYDAETINNSNDVTLVLMKEKKSPSCKGNCGYEVVTDLSVTGLINSGYMYNSDLSNCTGTSTISFNQTTNKINTVYNGQDTCTAYFKVSDAPIIKSVTLDSKTTSSLTFIVSTVQMAPKAVSYYYSLDGTNFTEVSGKTFTISSLTAGTEYNVRIYVKSADNISSSVSLVTESTDAYPNVNLIAGDATITSPDFTITNLLRNGDFENGSNYWSLSSSSVVTTYAYSGTHSLSFSTGTTAMSIQNNSLNSRLPAYPTLNHYYYGRLLVKSSSSWTTADSRFEWFYGDEQYVKMASFGAKVAAQSSDWTLLSNIVPITSSTYLSSSYYWVFRNFVVNGSIVTYVDDIMMLDLTASCGVNIPDKTWLDTNIKYFDDSMTTKNNVITTGSSTTFTVTALSGHTQGTSVTCNNGATGAISGTTITISNVTGDNICSIYAS